MFETFKTETYLRLKNEMNRRGEGGKKPVSRADML